MLRNKVAPLVEVLWCNQAVEETTWGNRNGYAREVSGVVLSFADETFISWRDCYILNFWRIVTTRELVVQLSVRVKYVDSIMEFMALLINVINCEY